MKSIKLSGYNLVSRRDRINREGGGIALFCLTRAFDTVTYLGDSDEFERSQHTLYTDTGPLLLCNWYRPPEHESESISELQLELDKYNDIYVGTVIIGDMNIYYLRWFRYSYLT